MILLITKYNLSPKWVQILTFLFFYLICIKLHYIDLNNIDLTECAPKKGKYSYSDRPKETPLADYLNGCITDGKETINLSSNTGDRLERISQVLIAHDRALAPIIAEAKVTETDPGRLLSEAISIRKEAIDTIPDLSSYVTLEQHRLLENRLDEYLNQQRLAAESPITASTQSLRSELNSNDLSSNIHLNELQKQLLELKKNQKGFYEAIENNIQPLSEELKSVSEKIKQMEEQLKSLSSLMGREKFEVLEERLRQLQALPEAPDGVITVQPGQNEGAPNRHLFELTDEMQEQIRQMALAEIERARNCCWRSIVNSWNGWRGNN